VILGAGVCMRGANGVGNYVCSAALRFRTLRRIIANRFVSPHRFREVLSCRLLGLSLKLARIVGWPPRPSGIVSFSNTDGRGRPSYGPHTNQLESQ